MALGTSGGFFSSRVDTLVSWARKNSLWPLVFGTACCSVEFMQAAGSRHDIARFGAEIIRFSPRQADLLIVAGTISSKQGPVLKRIYEQMPEPKWVIAMGACASSGGCYDNYATIDGVDRIIPVDVYVAGCPPRPEALLDALMEIQTRIARDKSRVSWERAHEGVLDSLESPDDSGGPDDAVPEGDER